MSIDFKKLKDASKLLFTRKFLGFMATWMVFLMFFGTLAFPYEANAFSITSFIKDLLGIGSTDAQEKAGSIPQDTSNTKPFPFLTPVVASDPKTADASSTELQFVEGTALMPSVGPLGNIVDAAQSNQSYKITTYTVRDGDTLSLIAKTFGVSPATIRWANDLSGGILKKGQVLVILPVSGVEHTVKAGDTVASIAKKYGGDPDDIYEFNGLTKGDKLAVGSIVVVPDGELPTPETPSIRPEQLPQFVRGGGPEIIGYYLRPLLSYIRTRGIHGFNGVDLANACGTPIYASASGMVIVAHDRGWNGGYGEYVVISHPNGTQTVYGHMSKVEVSTGVNVSQGQEVGLMGTTGKSTGCHLHFEVRGAKNPF